MDNLIYKHGGNIYEYDKKLVDFSANINPLGLPPVVKKALLNHIDRVLHYPDPEAKELTGCIARYWGIAKENVLVGNGSAELIYLAANTFKPKTTLIPVPTFSEYERASRSVKTKIQFLKLKEGKDFKFNPHTCEKADMLFICNPNNPTGNLILKGQKRIGKIANMIIADEAFMDFLPDQKNHTLIWRAVKEKSIIVIRTLTKFFALPGLRIGYIVAHKDNIKKLKQNKAPWSVNSLAQLAASLILKDKKYITKTYSLISKERDFLFKELNRIEGLRPYPSITNFILIKIEKNHINSGSLTKRLLKKEILIRNCANFRNLNDKYIRAAVRTREENLKLITALKKGLTD